MAFHSKSNVQQRMKLLPEVIIVCTPSLITHLREECFEVREGRKWKQKSRYNLYAIYLKKK